MWRKRVRFVFLFSVAVAAFPALLPNAASADQSKNAWAQYLDQKIGRTCTLSNSEVSSGVTVNSTLSQRLVDIHQLRSGEELDIEVRTVATASGVSPIVSQVVIPYTLLNNGDLGVAPSFGTISGFKWSFPGSEIYPSIAALAAHTSSSSRISGTLSATTPAGKSEIRQFLTSGDELELRLTFRVSPAPRVNSITTPAGIFTHTVGVIVSETSIDFVNGNSTAKAALRLVTALTTTTLYFAKNFGLVESMTGSMIYLLSSCSG